MSLIKLRNPFTYPSGQAAINLAHPATQNIRLLAVPSHGGGMICIAPGGRMSKVGSPTSSYAYFPGVYYPSGNVKHTLIAANETPKVITFAAVVTLTASVASGTPIANNDAATAATASIQFSSLQLAGHSNNGTRSSGIFLALNTPYFVAVSWYASKMNFVATNLLTGQIQSSTTAGLAIATTTSNLLTIGCFYSSGAVLGGHVHAALYSVSYLNLQQLQQWAADPWSPWYPDLDVTKYLLLCKDVGAAVGTIAVTEAPDTFAATGGIYGTGTIAVTEAADGVSSTGSVAWTTGLAVTEAPDTAAATGSVAWTTSLAITETPDTFAATGLLGAFGTLAVTETPDTFASTGSVAWTASLAVTDVNDTFASTGSVVWLANLATTEAPDVFSASGKVETLWDIAITEAADAFTATASVAWFANLAVTDVNDTFASTGSVAWTTDIAITELPDIFSAAGTVSFGNPAFLTMQDRLVWQASVNDLPAFKVKIGDST